MAQRLIVNHICPVCKKAVDDVPNHVLKREGDKYDVEFIQLKRGIKQYYHTHCWHEMIEQQKNGKKVAN